MISIILNTSCLGPRAREIHGSDGRTSTVHAMRAYALRCFILPAYASLNPSIFEIIIVGEFEEGEGYRYIHVPSVHFSSADALAQRQAGFEASRGAFIWHTHDDHFLDCFLPPHADVMVPERWTRLRGREEMLNNGWPDYCSGHACGYKREVLEACPWSAVPVVREWDVRHTAQIRGAGFSIAQAPMMRAWDVEFEATPWL